MVNKVKYKSLQEKIEAHQQRKINRMAWTTARMLINDDMKRGCSSIAAWSELDNYIAACKPIVEKLISENYPRIHIPRKAMKLYLETD